MSTSVASLSGNFFPSAENGFTTTTSGTVSSGASTVGLNSVAGYSNGEVAVFVIDPTDPSKKQTFTGIIDTSGVQVTSVVWTAGNNQTHSSGATVVDYATATHISMITKGLLVSHSQTGAIDATLVSNFREHIDMVDGKAIRDGNDNELLKVSQTASAVNEFTVKNAATGNAPRLQATGDDTNIDIELVPKGSGRVINNGAGVAAGQDIATDQGTTSATYTDLATVGPSVTVTVGTSGILLVGVGCSTNNNAQGEDYMSYAFSGANTLAASDANAFEAVSFVGGAKNSGSRTILHTGLTPGSTVITAKYRRNTSTGNFSNRHLFAIPL